MAQQTDVSRFSLEVRAQCRSSRASVTKVADWLRLVSVSSARDVETNAALLEGAGTFASIGAGVCELWNNTK